MNSIGKAFVAVLCVLVVASVIQAASPYVSTLGSNTGFKIGSSRRVTLSSAAATQITLPSGTHEAWVMSSTNTYNYGDAAISTGTYELSVATGTLKVFDKFITRTPTFYIRAQGGGTILASATVLFR